MAFPNNRRRLRAAKGAPVNFSEYEQLRFERRDNGVLLITMDRPDRYNAADEQMHSELARVWAGVSADPQTRVAVITGAGQAFSAGGDEAVTEQLAQDGRPDLRPVRRLRDALLHGPGRPRRRGGAHRETRAPVPLGGLKLSAAGTRLAAASLHSLLTLFPDEWLYEDDALKQYPKSARAYRVQSHT
jgi:hypothetical protein